MDPFLFRRWSLLPGVLAFTEEVEAAAARACGAERGRLLLLRHDHLERLRGRSPLLSVDEGTLAGACVVLAEPVTCGPDDPLALDEAVRLDDACRPVAAVPLRVDGRVLGVLEVLGCPAIPSPECLEALRALADTAVLALDVVQTRESHYNYRQNVEDLIARMLEQLVPGSQRHVLRMSRLATALALRLELSEGTRRRLVDACRWHDVGLFLLQGRPPEEVRQDHALAGASFLRSINVLQDLASWVEQHHERFDGSGYPRGSKGHEHDLEAAILAVCEDLDEGRAEHAGDVETQLASFFTHKAPSHHPVVVEALAGLAASGELSRLVP